MVIYILLFILFILYNIISIEKFSQIDSLKEIYNNIMKNYLDSLKKGNNINYLNNVDLQIESVKNNLYCNFERDNLHVNNRTETEFSKVKFITGDKDYNIYIENNLLQKLDEENNKLKMNYNKTDNIFQLINLKYYPEDNLEINKFIYTCKIKFNRTEKFLENSFNQLILNYNKNNLSQNWKIIFNIKI
jgi:hypothetical protein